MAGYSFYTSSSEITCFLRIQFKELLQDWPLDLISGTSICEICHQNDPILLIACGICKIIVHNYCYGTDAFSKYWICHPCYQIKIGEALSECIVCNNHDGAMRTHPSGWLHNLCEKWGGKGKLFNSRCKKCRSWGGFCVKCGECERTYHPYCGYLKGMRSVRRELKCKKCRSGEGKKEKEKQNNILEDMLVVETREKGSEGDCYKKLKIEEDEELENIEKNENSGSCELEDLTQEEEENKIETDGQKEIVQTAAGKIKTETTAKPSSAVKVDSKCFKIPKAITLSLTMDDLRPQIRIQSTEEQFLFKPEIRKLLKIKKNVKHPLSELSRQLETYLFHNTVLTNSGYNLNSSQKKIFKETSLFYHKFPEILYNYSTPA